MTVGYHPRLPRQSERLPETTVLAPNHEEHADRAPQADHVLHGSAQLRKHRAAPLALGRAIALERNVANRHTGPTAAAAAVCGRRRPWLVSHDVETDDGPKAMRDDRHLPAPGPATARAEEVLEP